MTTLSFLEVSAARRSVSPILLHKEHAARPDRRNRRDEWCGAKKKCGGVLTPAGAFSENHAPAQLEKRRNGALQ